MYDCAHLLQPSTPGAQEDHAVSVVNIGGDRGQPVPALSVHRPTRHQLGSPQGLVYIQAAEVVIDGNWLHGGRNGVETWGEGDFIYFLGDEGRNGRLNNNGGMERRSRGEDGRYEGRWR